MEIAHTVIEDDVEERLQLIADLDLLGSRQERDGQELPCALKNSLAHGQHMTLRTTHSSLRLTARRVLGVYGLRHLPVGKEASPLDFCTIVV